jgi:hypothetical protein
MSSRRYRRVFRKPRVPMRAAPYHLMLATERFRVWALIDCSMISHARS